MDTSMNPTPKAMSLNDIHSVYTSVDLKPAKSESENAIYKKSTRFDRDSTHSGIAPAKPVPPSKSRR